MAYGWRVEQVTFGRCRYAKEELLDVLLSGGAIKPGSTLLPLEVALDAFVEDGGRLISRPNLNLHEVGALTATMAHVRALHRGRVGVFESFSTAKHIVYFLPLEVHLIFKLGLNLVYVGARSAEKAEVVTCLLCQQNVRACWAKKHLDSIRLN